MWAFSPGPSRGPCDGFSCRLLVGAGRQVFTDSSRIASGMSAVTFPCGQAEARPPPLLQRGLVQLPLADPQSI